VRRTYQSAARSKGLADKLVDLLRSGQAQQSIDED